MERGNLVEILEYIHLNLLGGGSILITVKEKDIKSIILDKNSKTVGITKKNNSCSFYNLEACSSYNYRALKP